MRRSFMLTLVASAALFAACGGGGRGDSVAVRAEQARPTERAQALAVVGAKELFDWAQYKFPDLLGGAFVDFPAPIPYQGANYTVRHVPGKGAYMGLSDTGQVVALAPFTNNNLQGFGPLSALEPLIQADSCSVYPGSCAGTQPPGPLNGCTMPAAQALVTGNRWILRYETTGASSGTSDFDAVVDGPVTFEGQTAIRTSGTINSTFTVQGSPGYPGYPDDPTTTTSTTRSRTFEQAASGGFINTLGHEGEFIVAGAIASSSRSVYNPHDLNGEYGLQAGQSLTKTSSGTVTTTMPGLPASTVTFSDRETYTYEARDSSMTVRGRTYDTCRYRTATPGIAGVYTVHWFVFGKGIAVRTQSVAGTETTTTELVSGTFNGAPI